MRVSFFECKECEASRRFSGVVRQFRLFEKDEPLLVAVSGGVDSVTLLHLLLHLPPSIRPKVSVAHFNHRLRGKTSDREAQFVKETCREWGVPFHSGLAPVWKDRSNLQARARELRYRFFRKKAEGPGIQKIVTAHHADDQVETFLIRWLQGAGLKGLSGIRLEGKMDNLLLIRPLLFVSRSEIEAYAGHHRIPYREDPTNRKPVYLRNRIRRLISSLRQENPNLGRRISLNALFLQADQNLLEEETEKAFERTVHKGTRGFRCSIRGWRRIDRALRYRLLQRMVQGLSSGDSSLPAELILKMEQLLLQDGGVKRYDLPNGIQFEKRGGAFELSKRR